MIFPVSKKRKKDKKKTFCLCRCCSLSLILAEFLLMKTVKEIVTSKCTLPGFMFCNTGKSPTLWHLYCIYYTIFFSELFNKGSLVLSSVFYIKIQNGYLYLERETVIKIKYMPFVLSKQRHATIYFLMKTVHLPQYSQALRQVNARSTNRTVQLKWDIVRLFLCWEEKTK